MRPRTLRAVVVLGFLLWVSGPACAQTNGTWNSDANGTYSAGANWLGGVPNAGGTATFSGVISETAASGIVVNMLAGYPDFGVVTLNGANTFTGGLTLQTGTVVVAHNSALGTGTLTVNGGYLRGGTPTATTITNAVQLNAD